MSGAAGAPAVVTFTLERDALAAALAAVTRIVERRTTVPVLNNLRVVAKAGTVHFTGTDIDMEATAKVSGDLGLTAEGATTLPALTLQAIVSKLPSGAQVSLSWDDSGTATLRSGRSRFNMPTLPVQDFPSFDTGTLDHSFRISGSDLEKLFGGLQFAVSTEETKFYLGGIYLHTVETEDGPRLRGVATDGVTLGLFDLDLPAGAAGMPGVIVPRKTISEALRIAKDIGGDTLEIALSPVKIRFSARQVTFVSKLIDATFPNYARIIPSEPPKRALFDHDELSAAMARVAVIQETNHGIRIDLRPGEARLSVRNNAGQSAGEEIIACEWDDAPLTFGISGKRVADILGALDSDTAIFRMSDPGSPVVLRASDTSRSLYLCMPMRAGETMDAEA